MTMNNEEPHFIFFMDDFGTRTMCKPADTLPMESHIFSFGIGGIIVPSEEVNGLSEKTKAFCLKWNVPHLHGNKIRSGKGKFSFLKNDEAVRAAFFNELEALIIDPQLLAHACLICRPGYRDRYYEKHAEGSRWHMSKTAFNISVERAAKYALLHGRKLSVAFEKTGQKEDRLMMGYFNELRKEGTGFSPSASSIHKPLTQADLSECLRTIWSDTKDNAMLQLADLILHPLSDKPTGRYNRAHDALTKAGQIIDFRNGGDETISVKYSCYDEKYKEWLDPKKLKGPEGPLRRLA